MKLKTTVVFILLKATELIVIGFGCYCLKYYWQLCAFIGKTTDRVQILLISLLLLSVILLIISVGQLVCVVIKPLTVWFFETNWKLAEKITAKYFKEQK
ncbi:MAG: hypothetical protein WDA13_03975, partial [Candidatus Shapirobacteria bacterium]|jgi:hypothetical protein